MAELGASSYNAGYVILRAGGQVALQTPQVSLEKTFSHLKQDCIRLTHVHIWVGLRYA